MNNKCLQFQCPVKSFTIVSFVMVVYAFWAAWDFCRCSTASGHWTDWHQGSVAAPFIQLS